MRRGARCLAFAALAAIVGAAPAEDLIGTDEQVARIDVCYDFGCASRKRVYIFDTEWQPVAALLRGSTSAADERARLARALGLMEDLVGEVTPTGADRAGNAHEGGGDSGQMDCVDESTNATTYLDLFAAQHLLRFHRVRERVYRAPLLIDQHWAAQVEETGSGRRFAVDSWFRDNGEPALVLPLGDWEQGVGLPAAVAQVGAGG